MHPLATLMFLGALALNVRLAWWFHRHRHYTEFLEQRLMEARRDQLHDLVKNLGKTLPHPTVEEDEAQVHLRHLMDETGMTEAQLREHLAEKELKPEDVDVIRLPRRLFGVPEAMIEALMGGTFPDKCPLCKKPHPPYGSEGTETTEAEPSGKPTS